MANEIKVAVCVPTSGQVKAWFAHSLAALMAYGNSLAQRPEAEAILLTLFMQETSVIHANRETLAKQALDWGATHVLFLDDDMVFDPRVLTIMLGRRHPMVACNYPKRGWPITFTAVRPDGKSHLTTREESTGLEEAAYAGFGVSLIERRVFEQTPKPWFLPLYLQDAEMYTTEDNPFCARIKAAGFATLVDHDASKMIGHVGMHTFDWKQWRPPEPKPSAEIVNLKGAA